MTDKIQQARRAMFEAWAIEKARSMKYSFPEESVQVNGLGDYAIVWVQGAWQGFNAALDCVVIELPERTDYTGSGGAIDACRAAIASTNLGLRIK